MEAGIGMQLVHALDIEDKISMSFHMDEEIVMDMDIDVDVFRPSSMLDAKIEEEYGPFYSSRLQNDFLCEEGDFIDLEQVLLCDSNDMSIAHLIQKDEEYMRRSVGAVEMISLDSKFLIQKTDRSKIFRIGNTVTAMELPPKYRQDSVEKRCSIRKKVAHRRTFGVLNKPFSFGGSTCSFQPATNVKVPESHAETPQEVAISCNVENEQPLNSNIITEVSHGKSSIPVHKTSCPDDVQFSTPFRSHTNDMFHLEKTPTYHAAKTFDTSISPTSARKMAVVQINSSMKNVVGDVDTVDCQEVGKVCDSLETNISLPPRYYRGAQSSPQKRRIHSTTFGSFARSFSFSPSPQTLSS